MDYIAVHELKSPRKVRERLAKHHEMLITNNGKPMALLIDIEKDEDPEELIKAARMARSELALRRIRETARRFGTAEMLLKDIDTVVKAVRKERPADAKS